MKEIEDKVSSTRHKHSLILMQMGMTAHKYNENWHSRTAKMYEKRELDSYNRQKELEDNI